MSRGHLPLVDLRITPLTTDPSSLITSYLAVGLALMLISGLLAALPVLAGPAEISALKSQILNPPSATPILGFDARQTVDTGATADGATAYNGDTITYALTLSNTGTVPITDLALLDFLPDTVQDIHVLNEGTIAVTCNPATTCERALVSKVFPEPLGGSLAVTATAWITWRVPSLLPGERATLTISGRVEGQADGSAFINRAFVDFKQGDQSQSYTFDEAPISARLRVATDGNIVSQTPNWFSSDLGGTLSQDWGDFDRDGYLDLALGSSLGPTVYRNDHGRLVKFTGFASARPAYGVRWADLNGDGQLELITVGDSEDGTPSSAGINRVYTYQAGRLNETQVWMSDYQLVRVIAVNFNPALTRTLDLIASANSINAPCPVQRFRNDTLGHLTPAECISADATAALSVGDFNNDGLPDLALGRFPNAVRLLINHAGVLTETNTVTQTNSVTFDTSPFLPYDFAWGDYDGDGFLDLAAAFPLQRQARIYHNLGGNATQPFQLSGIIATQRFMTPLAVDWGDFSGAGRLELLVADDPPKIYLNPAGALNSRSASLSAGLPRAQGAVWSARAVALDNQSLSLALSNQTGPSLVYQTSPAQLRPALTAIAGAPAANSAAWGDVNGDGLLDLLMGAGANSVPTRLYVNTGGLFDADHQQSFFSSGFGPHSATYGDLNGDGALEAVISTGNSRLIDIYLIGSALQRTASISMPAAVNAVALGDANDDGKLDLLVGLANGQTRLYRNTNGALGATPIWSSAPTTGTVRSVAWADVNGDRYMDFAVGYDRGPALVYRNNHDETFTPIFTSTLISRTTSLAWGDYNRDGYPDLAVGTYGEGNLIYDNNAGSFTPAPIHFSAFLSQTTSVAWGDWNNDGQIDLAVGNDGAPNQVYANLGSTPGSPRLSLKWQSAEVGATTAVAWGDVNQDGYLDLAVSRQSGSSGVYHNTGISPSHLAAAPQAGTLPLQPSYLSIPRPGVTRDAYLYSSSELLSGRFAPTVTVRYTVYSPNGSRAAAESNFAGTPITNTRFEYSVDGGSHWRTASAAISNPLPITQTARLGAPGVFVWDAQVDQAISDNALFRVSVVDQSPVGPVQRAASAAVSPPFRVRGLTCVWPANPNFTTEPASLAANIRIKFIGTLGAGSGAITYTWNFGDGGSGIGQTVTHTFTSDKIYTITLRVIGQPCPITRPVTVTRPITVGRPLNHALYLPLVARLPVGNKETGTAGDKETGQQAAAADGGIVISISLRPGITSALTASPLGYNSGPVLNLDGTRVAYWSTADTFGATAFCSGCTFGATGLRNPDGNVELFVASIKRLTGEVTYTQITSSTGSILGGFNFGPSIDDAGERVAFFSDRDLTGGNSDHNFEIFLAQIDANQAVTLTQLTTTTDGSNIFPSITAAGRRIAFMSDRDLTGGNPDLNPEIFILDLDAATRSKPLTITQATTTDADTFGNDQPALDRDGSHLTFISDEADAFQPGSGGNPERAPEVFMADLRGAARGVITYTRVTTSASGTVNEKPMISPDGADHIISFMASDNVQRLVKAVRVGPAGTLTPLNLPGGQRDQPALNRSDGSRLVTLSPTGQQVDVLDAVTLRVTTVYGAAEANLTSPALSSDGRRVGYVSNRQIYLAYYPITDLAMTKVGSRSETIPGSDLNYTLVITNQGADLATNVTLTDTLPMQLDEISQQQDQTDDDNDATGGFGAGVKANITWLGSALGLNSTPRVWQLPDNGVADWVNMTSTRLLLHLDAGGTYSDTSGRNHSAFCDPGCPTGVVSGQLNGAANFQLGSGLGLTNDADLNFDENGSFSVMAWIRTAIGGQNSGTHPKIIIKRGATQGYTLQLQNRTQAALELTGGVVLAGGADLRDNQWHLLVGTVDRAQAKAALYVDGQRVRELAFTGSVSNTSDLRIGRWAGDSDAFIGDIDEVAIVRRAWSASEISWVYQLQAVARAGYFESRVMDGVFPTAWTQLAWTPQAPYGKELPDDRATETGYLSGTAVMTSNITLLHFNEAAGSTVLADTSGLNRHGQCVGSACPTAGMPGQFNTALRFDGVDDAVSLPARDPGGSGVTFEAWVNFAAYDGAIFDFGNSVDNSGLMGVWLFADTSGRLVLQSRYPSYPGTVSSQITSTATQLNQWTHVAAVLSANGDGALYVNGTLAAAGLRYQPITPTLQYLGSSPLGPGKFKGGLDEVALYQMPLAADTIRDHYQRGALRLRFQARSCATPDCADGVYTGPDGAANTFYRDDRARLLPTLPITVPVNQYFQYRALFQGEPVTPLPGQLRAVTIEPPHRAVGATQGSCSGARQISCDLGDMAPGLTVTVRIHTVVNHAASGEADNQAGVDSFAADHVPANNHAKFVTQVADSADLSISAPISMPIMAGQPVTYTFIVTNAGPGLAAAIVISNALPAGLTLQSITPEPNASGVSCDTGSPLTCLFPAGLPAGSGDFVSMTLVALLDPAARGELVNTGETFSDQYDPVPENNFTTRTSPIQARADLSVTKWAPASSIAEQLITYTLGVVNRGPATATGVVITDQLPTNVALKTVPPGCATTPGYVRCVAGSLNVNQVHTVTLTVVGLPSALATVVNRAEVRGVEVDPDASNDTVTRTTTLEAIANLALTKAATPTGTVDLGEVITYTLFVTNTGPSSARVVTVTDVLPRGVALQSADPRCVPDLQVLKETGKPGREETSLKSQTVYQTTRLTCSVGQLSPTGSSSTFVTVVVTVTQNAGMEIVNTATVTATESPLTATSAVTHSVRNVRADLTMTKSATPTLVTAGDAVTYTLTITNGGPFSADNVIVTDTLPAGLTFTSEITPGVFSLTHSVNNQIVWTAPFLEAGAPTLIVFKAAVAAALPPTATVSNAAVITSRTPDPSAGNNSAQATSLVTTSADLAIRQSGPAWVTAGTRLTYTLTITNRGPSDARQVVVTDTLDAGLTYQVNSYTSDQPFTGPTIAGQRLRWQLATLPVNGAGTITFTAEVSSTISAPTIVNQASVAANTPDPSAGNNSATGTTTVAATASLILFKTTEPADAPAIAGQALTYRLTVFNTGPSQATSLTLTDTLPSGLTFQSASAGCADAANVIRCTAPTLLDQQIFTITVNLSRSLASGTTLVNTAEVTATGALATASDRYSITITTHADLAIGKQAPATGTAGARLPYTLTITNRGPSDARQVVLTDILSDSLTYQAGSFTSDRPFTETVAGQQLTWTLATLPAQDTGTLTFTVKVSDTWPRAAVIVNTAVITSGTPDPSAANNTAPVTSTITTSADLAIGKQGPDSVAAGTSMTYTLTVENYGPSVAQAVTLTDLLNDGLTYQAGSFTSDRPFTGPTIDGQQLTWQLAALPVNGTGTLTFRVAVTNTLTGPTIVNTAVITSSTPDPGADNNTAQSTSAITTSADLAIGKHGPASVVAGTRLTYTLVITNLGLSAAQAVILTDILSDGLTYQAGAFTSDRPVTETVAGQQLTWELATLPANDTGTITFTVDVTNTLPGGAAIVNRASIASDTIDPNPLNDHATITTTATVAASLHLLKATDPVNALATAGDPLTYTLTVINSGPSQVTDVIVTDTLPGELKFDSASADCTDAANVIRCTVPTLGIDPLDQKTFTITVKLKNNLKTGDTVTNTAYVTATGAISVASGSQSVTVNATSADLAITKIGTPDVVVAGTSMTYTLFVTNTGPSDAQNVTITDTLPISLTYTNWFTSDRPFTETVAGQQLTWELATLPVSGTGTITFTVKVAVGTVIPPFSTILINTAVIASSTPDPVTGNNSAQAASTITTSALTTSADLAIGKYGPAKGVAGTRPTYAPVSANLGPSAAQAICPLKAPERKEADMMEFLTRASYGLIIGNFELELEDGEIRYKTRIDVEEAELTAPLIKPVVYANVLTMDQYWPGLLAVLFGGASPDEALARVEK